MTQPMMTVRDGGAAAAAAAVGSAAGTAPPPPSSLCCSSIPAAVQQLVSGLTGAQAGSLAHKQLLGTAWSVLLDLLDGGDPQLLPDDCARAVAEACGALHAQRRAPEAQQLQQLAAQLGSIQQQHKSTAQQADALQAVLSLLLALRGSKPRCAAVMTTLPALGSAALEAQLEAAAAADADSQPPGGSSSPPRSWVSPAAAALDLLQAMPLDAAAASTRPPPAAASSHPTPAGSGQQAAGSLFEAATQTMQRAADASRLGQPLGVCTSSTTSSSSATAVQPAVLPLMALASAPPPQPAAEGADACTFGVVLQRASSCGGGGGGGDWLDSEPSAVGIRYQALSRRTSSSNGGGCGPWDGSSSRRSTLDSAFSSEPSGLGRAVVTSMLPQKQQRDADDVPRRAAAAAKGADMRLARDQQLPAAAGGSQRRAAAAEAEGELVSLVCLAVQGVWSATAQLWQLAVGATVEGAGGGSGVRATGLARAPAQQHVLMQLLHIAELRLRVAAFVQHFQQQQQQQHSTAADGEPTAAGDQREAAEQGAVLCCFLAAVQQLLDVHGASLQQLQAQLRRQQRSGRPPTLLQLVAQLRGVRCQLQQLAALCWCCVDEFLERRLYISSSAVHTLGTLPLDPGLGGSSSTVTWHVLQRAGGGSGWRRRRSTLGGGDSSTASSTAAAAAAAVLAAAAAAQDAALLPWGGGPQAAAWAQRLGWAPSSWQLRGAFLKGYALLEHLHTEVLAAPPEAAALLRHLFAAAIQPVLHVVRAWTFLPSTDAAQAAAAAAALTWSAASGGSSSSSTPGVAAAHARLLQAWQTARTGGPRLPAFLAPLQQQVDIAGMQLQLLQLLGGSGQQLAARLGWLAELEQQELREALGSAAAAAAATTHLGNSTRQHAPSGGGGGSSVVQFVPSDACASHLPANLSAAQLQDCAAILSEYAAARQAELSRVLSGLAAQRAAGEAAREARDAARLEAKAAAEQQRQQLVLEAGARRRQRQQRLLAAQQAQLAEAADRRTAARLGELTLERSLLLGAAAAEHQAAAQLLQAELDLSTLTAAAAATAEEACDDAAPEAAGAEDESEGSGASTCISVSDDDDEAGVQLGAGSDVAAAATADQPAAAGGLPKERATWGRPVADIGPAAGRPSEKAQLEGVPGSAAASAAAAAVPAAGRRSNSQPRLLLGMGRPLSGSSSSSSGHLGDGSLGRSGGLGQAWGSALSGRSVAGGGTSSSNSQAAALPRGKWGLPVVPGAAAGVGSGAAAKAWRTTTGGILGADPGCSDSFVVPGRPLSARRLSELGGATALQQQRQQQQQQQQAAPAAELALYAVLQQEDPAGLLLPGAAAGGASGQHTSSATGVAAAAAPGSQGSSSGRQQQGHQEQGNVLLLDWLLQQQGSFSADGREHGRQPKHAAAPDKDACGSPGDEAAVAAASAPVMSVLEVMLVQPLLAQHRLTTVACWSMLLQQHRLVPRLRAIQGLFFQQHGDWVALLCDGLDGLRQQQQQVVGELSPVALQLLLESAVQQSCLAAAPEAEVLTLSADAARTLAGWGTILSRGATASSSRLAAAAAAAAAASDVLVLAYAVPWPLSLLVGPQQLARYADVFSVLLRLRRLQHRLTQQWQPLNARPGGCSSSSSSSKGGRARRAAAAGQAADDGRPTGAAAAGLRELRQWHALALRSVEALLAHMLGELSGRLWASFESALTERPVSLPFMLAAHERLLAAAQRVCMLPEHPPHDGQQQPEGGASLVMGVYALVQSCWQLQLQVAELLQQADADEQLAGSGSRLEGGSARRLSATLAGGGRWAELAATGTELTRTLGWVRRKLSSDCAAAVPGHPLAGLAARLA